MRKLLAMVIDVATGEWLVWGLLGLASVLLCAVILRVLGARAKGRLTARRHRAHYQRFYEQVGNALTHLEALLLSLPESPVGTFLRWRVTHRVEPEAVNTQIAWLVAEAEGNSGRLLDVVKVTSPLLGLAGTLLGLQQAFSQAHLGKAAVESGISVALNTTFAGIFLAIAAFCTLRFMMDPALERLEAELWEAEVTLNEAMHVRRESAVRQAAGPARGPGYPWAGGGLRQQSVAGLDDDPLDR